MRFHIKNYYSKDNWAEGEQCTCLLIIQGGRSLGLFLHRYQKENLETKRKEELPNWQWRGWCGYGSKFHKIQKYENGENKWLKYMNNFASIAVGWLLKENHSHEKLLWIQKQPLYENNEYEFNF